MKFMLIVLDSFSVIEAVRLVGYIGEKCHGQRLWTFDIPSGHDCYYRLPAVRSMTVSNYTERQFVRIYANDECSGIPTTTFWAYEGCFSDSWRSYSSVNVDHFRAP